MNAWGIFLKVIIWGIAVILLTVFLVFYIMGSLTELAQESRRPLNSFSSKALVYLAKGLALFSILTALMIYQGLNLIEGIGASLLLLMGFYGAWKVKRL